MTLLQANSDCTIASMFPHLSYSALKQLLIIALPTVMYSLLEILVGAVDIYMAWYLGHEAVAAIGFARQLFLVLMISTLAITTGTITLISQHYGAKNYKLASSVAYHSIVLSIVGGVFFGLIGVWISKPSLFLMGARDEVLVQSSAYLNTMISGVIFMLLNFSTTAVFRAVGDSKTPMNIAIIMNLLNVLFNYLLMFGIGPFPALGVQGLALGTILSRVVGAAIAFYLLTRPGSIVSIRFEKDIHLDIIYKMMYIGIPSGVSGFARNGARILFFAIIASYGTYAVAAATAGFQIRLFAIMPALAFQIAASTLAGQFIGKKELDQAVCIGWTNIAFVSTAFFMECLLLFCFPASVMSIFSDDPHVIDLGVITLRCIAVEQFCNCISIAAHGALAGAGDTTPSMRYTILTQWMLMLPASLFFSYGLGWGLHGAWLIWGCIPAIQAALTINRFASGKWKQLAVR